MIYTNGLSQWLSASIICLLVGGTLAAKTVFLVDNNLELQTELNSQNWYLDSQSHQLNPSEIEKLAYHYIERLTELPERKAWCSSATEMSLVLAKAKSLHLIEVNNLAPGKADIIVKLPQNHLIQSAHKLSKTLSLSVSSTRQGKIDRDNWCISGN